LISLEGVFGFGLHGDPRSVEKKFKVQGSKKV
jgi:hypothetical protein